VILGAGPAALSAAQTLRQAGFEGEIVMLTKDNEIPFDRTGLSKGTMGVSDINKMALKDKSWYTEYDVNLLLESTVQEINYDKKELTVGKDKIKFDKLLFATGGSANVPKIKGVELKNILTLRSFHDAVKIKDTAQHSKKIVIIGASFIGLETASAIKKELKDAVDITVVDIAPVPFEKSLGKEVGKAL